MRNGTARKTAARQRRLWEDHYLRTIRPNDPDTVQVLRFVEAAGLRETCDLDLLLFFSRHPRVVLSSEQLATYVGYEVQQVARALELLLGAGLVSRVLNPGVPGRMYVLEVAHVEEWLEPLRRLCATPDGRYALRTSLKARRSQAQPQTGRPDHA